MSSQNPPAEYVVVIEHAADGSYSAYVPDLPGCVACGETLAEVRALIAESVKLHIESLRSHNETVPPPSTTVDRVRAA
ncbi:MAG: type II toxin-antitoxin system HicB family antitoxin [Phycisphaerales bacterium]|nr:type II toxin-antitoxin system HicB family antitoxin [Phycisphaerales bacterium]